MQENRNVARLKATRMLNTFVLNSWTYLRYLWCRVVFHEVTLFAWVWEMYHLPNGTVLKRKTRLFSKYVRYGRNAIMFTIYPLMECIKFHLCSIIICRISLFKNSNHSPVDPQWVTTLKLARWWKILPNKVIPVMIVTERWIQHSWRCLGRCTQ